MSLNSKPYYPLTNDRSNLSTINDETIMTVPWLHGLRTLTNPLVLFESALMHPSFKKQGPYPNLRGQAFILALNKSSGSKWKSLGTVQIRLEFQTSLRSTEP